MIEEEEEATSTTPIQTKHNKIYTNIILDTELFSSFAMYYIYMIMGFFDTSTFSIWERKTMEPWAIDFCGVCARVCVWVFLCEPYEKLHSLIRHMMHGIGMFDDENNKQFTRVQWNTSSICGSIDDNKKLRSNRHCTIVVSASFKHFGKNVHTQREKEQFIRMYNNRMNEAEFLIEYHGETVFVSDFLFPCIYPQFACITWLIYFFSFFPLSTRISRTMESYITRMYAVHILFPFAHLFLMRLSSPIVPFIADDPNKSKCCAQVIFSILYGIWLRIEIVLG